MSADGKLKPVSPDEADDYCLDEQVGYLLRLAYQRHAILFQEQAILGLTPTQFAALVRLGEVGQCSQNMLGRLTAMDVATIKGVIGRLHKRGLVTLANDPTDKRRTLISLNDDGKAILGDLHDMGRAVTEDTLSRLSAADQRTFLRLLKKLT